MDNFPLYKSLIINLPEKDITSVEKKEFIKKVSSMEETHDLIFTLIRCFYYEHEKKECFIPYSGNLNGKDIEFDFSEFPQKLRQLLYKFIILHNKKILEDKQLEKVKISF